MIVVATAQETYSEMMKATIAPGLRTLGFKGSGQNYAIPSATYWAVLSFQKSRYSDSDKVSFTINVLVVSRDAWEAAKLEHSVLPARPAATTYWGPFVWQERIGGLVPGAGDLWWDVRADSETDELSAAVLRAVEDYALPAMRTQMS